MKFSTRCAANLLLALTAFAATGTALHRPAVAATADVATVAVQSDAPAEKIRPGLFGTNLQWTDRGDGVLAAAGSADPWQPGLLNAIRELGITSLRFPGGALADRYRWQSTLGPVGQRAPGINFGGGTEPSVFGVDEFLRLSQSTGASPVITINLVAGAEEAADWVEYLNGDAKTKMGARRIADGFPHPAGAVYWEIGNEPDSAKAAEHLSAHDYALAIKKFAAAMKARDPSIKIGAALEASFQRAAWLKSVFPDLLTWNQEVLSAAGQDIDFVSLHFYAPFDTPFTEKARRELVWAGPEVFDLTLGDITELLKRYGKPGIGLAVTEYNVFFGGARPDEHSASTDSALFSAMMLMRFMDDSRIELANNWSLIDNNVFGMLQTQGGKLSERPLALIFRELSQFAGLRRTPLSIDSPNYKVPAKGNVPDLDHVPALCAFAAQDEQGHLRIVLVNRGDSGALPISLTFAKASPSRLMSRTWSSADRSGTRWGPAVAQTLTPVDGRFSLTLDSGSFSVLTQP